MKSNPCPGCGLLERDGGGCGRAGGCHAVAEDVDTLKARLAEVERELAEARIDRDAALCRGDEALNRVVVLERSLNAGEGAK